MLHSGELIGVWLYNSFKELYMDLVRPRALANREAVELHFPRATILIVVRYDVPSRITVWVEPECSGDLANYLNRAVVREFDLSDPDLVREFDLSDPDLIRKIRDVCDQYSDDCSVLLVDQ